jgi:exo-beta-1,3-glucanase (GH17 family)
MKPTWLPALRATFALTLVAACAACGGGGAGGYTPSAVSQSDRRELPQAFITRASVNYSPYRSSRNESELSRELITPANVLEDLRLVQATGIGTIRLFSSRAFAETVLKVIKDNNLDIKVQLGAYPNPVANAAAEADNQAELDACIRLANAYRDIVLAVSVGNETMVEWSTHKIDPSIMAGYLRKVRAAVTQPVTTNDNWLFWASVPKEVAATVDYAAVHVYPFLDTFYNPTKYDWRQKATPEAGRAKAMIDATLAEAKLQFNDARAGLAKLNLGQLPMVIGETGWAAVDTPGGPNLAFRAHPVNQRMFFEGLQAWVQQGRQDVQGPKAIFYFQAFDEPWKQGDDGWGLFNTRREARYVVQSAGTCGVTWTCEAGSYTAADAVKWQLPTQSPAITAARYTLFADTPVAGEVRASGLRWDPFASTATARPPASTRWTAASTSRSRRTRWTTAGACSTTRPAARWRTSPTSVPGASTSRSAATATRARSKSASAPTPRTATSRRPSCKSRPANSATATTTAGARSRSRCRPSWPPIRSWTCAT